MPKREHFKTARFTAQLQQGRNDWYSIENSAASDTATVHVYDEIGYFGVSAAEFIDELHAITARNIDLRISSPGGSVFDGFAIFEALRAHPAKVTTYVDSLAASIASVIALAGDRVVVGKFAEFMVHEASGLCIGNADDMRKMIEDLDRESTRIASVYADRSGGTVDEWRQRMRAETWFSADEAVAAGLADEVSSPAPQAAAPEGDQPTQEPAARWDLSVFRYAGRDQAPAPQAATARLGEDGPEPVEPNEPQAKPDPEGTHLVLKLGEQLDDDTRALLRRITDPQDALSGEPVQVPTEAPAEVVQAPEPRPDDPAPATDGEPSAQADDWAAMTAHLTETPVDDWAHLVAHLTSDTVPSSSAATA